MAIVAGIECSSQLSKIIVCDSATGAVLRQSHSPHPELASARPPAGEPPVAGARRAETDPKAWLLSLSDAARDGMLEGVQAIGVSAQQHAMLAMDATGALVRPAVLWNDQRATGAAADLTEELGGPQAWAQAVGSVPQAAYTVAKLRWLAQAEPAAALRTAAVLLPHDWLTWQLLGCPAERGTDRGDASGTGYWSAATGNYRTDLVELALGHQVALPRVLGPAEPAGRTPEGLLISAGTGDNMAAALGLGVGLGDAVVSLGASGTIFAVHHEALVDPSGTITSFADATGHHLPVVHTLNATRVLRGAAELLGTDLDGLSELALRSTPGAYGLVLLPYLEGERIPPLPHAAGTLTGLRRDSMKPEHLARAAVEGMLCGLADALDVLRGRGVAVRRVFLLGLAANLPAVQVVAPAVFGAPVVVPQPAEYPALGAARQAAWALAAESGTGSALPPPWRETESRPAFEPGDDLAVGQAIRQQFQAAREQMHPADVAAAGIQSR